MAVNARRSWKETGADRIVDADGHNHLWLLEIPRWRVAGCMRARRALHTAIYQNPTLVQIFARKVKFYVRVYVGALESMEVAGLG